MGKNWNHWDDITTYNHITGIIPFQYHETSSKCPLQWDSNGSPASSASSVCCRKLCCTFSIFPLFEAQQPAFKRFQFLQLKNLRTEFVRKTTSKTCPSWSESGVMMSLGLAPAPALFPASDVHYWPADGDVTNHWTITCPKSVTSQQQKQKHYNITAKTSTIEEFHMENHMFSHMVPEKDVKKHIWLVVQ